MTERFVKPLSEAPPSQRDLQQSKDLENVSQLHCLRFSPATQATMQ